MSVFDELIGQDDVVAILRRAADAAAEVVAGRPGSGMTHAWMFTGPAGSGRSVAARAFAAALQCPDRGCGHCGACHTVMSGTHADVRNVVPDGLTIGVADMRALVVQAASAPSGGRWQIVLVEDADRLTEAAANALLKAIEEPGVRTVFLLCTPSTHPEDVPVTIRSRCRVVALRTPAPEAVAALLTSRDGIPAERAQWAAQAAQGHVGRARRLARDEEAAARRAAVLAIPRSLTNLGACFAAASELIAASEAEAAAYSSERDAGEIEALNQAYGAGGTGKGAAQVARGTAGARKELEKRQKSRATRAQRDALDRALVDLAAFYRDVLTVKLVGEQLRLVHPDMASSAAAAAARWSAESIVRRIDAILDCQNAIAVNVKPKIAVESMMLALHQG